MITVLCFYALSLPSFLLTTAGIVAIGTPRSAGQISKSTGGFQA
jgi:hypothetical protein